MAGGRESPCLGQKSCTRGGQLPFLCCSKQPELVMASFPYAEVSLTSEVFAERFEFLLLFN